MTRTQPGTADLTASSDSSDGYATVESIEELTELLGEPNELVRNKARGSLTDLDKDWLSAARFCVIATADETGRCDASPKGDPAGQLVHVIDDTTIAIAERPGNRRADGYHNILRNPHVGLNFVIPGRGDTLRINGRARLVREAPFFAEMVVRNHRPILAVLVEIEELYFHCAKAFMRAELWKPETWHPQDVVPRRAVLAKKVDHDPRSPDELEMYYSGEEYERLLYG